MFQLIPGPGTLAILNATAKGGVRAGSAAVLGTIAGDFIYIFRHENYFAQPWVQILVPCAFDNYWK